MHYRLQPGFYSHFRITHIPLFSPFLLAYFVQPPLTIAFLLGIFSFFVSSFFCSVMIRIYSRRLLFKHILALFFLFFVSIPAVFLIISSPRYLQYLFLSETGDYSNATQSSGFFIHALPFLFFSLFLLVLYTWSSLVNQSSATFPARLDKEYRQKLFSGFLAFFLFFSIYLYAGISGINPNVIGRTSILYSSFSFLYVILFVPQILAASRFSVKLTFSGLVFVPLLVRSFTSYIYSMSLS